MDFEQMFEDLYPTAVVRAGRERKIRRRVPDSFPIPAQNRQLIELHHSGAMSAEEFGKAKAKMLSSLQKGHQCLSSSFIIEISPPGGKKSGRSKVVSGR
jgi:hypothetical protein